MGKKTDKTSSISANRRMDLAGLNGLLSFPLPACPTVPAEERNRRTGLSEKHSARLKRVRNVQDFAPADFDHIKSARGIQTAGVHQVKSRGI